MNAKRSYYVMCGLVVLLIVAIAGAAYEGQTMLKQESGKLVGLKAKVDALNRQQIALQKAKKDVAASRDLYKIAKVIVPENKNQAQAVRQIVQLAADNKVAIASINFPASSLGSGPAAGTVKPAAGAAAAGPSAAAGSNPTLSQLTPVLQIPGVYNLKLTVTSSTTTLASYKQLISFLSSLENNRQTALVSSISITPDASVHDQFSFSLVLDIYIKP